MRTSTWLTIVAVCLVRASAQTTKNFDKKCLALQTCLKGGVQSNPCTIADERCPPCITFNNNGCFELDTTGKCPFGDDCTPYFPMNGGTTNSPTATTTTLPNTADPTKGPDGLPITSAVVTPAPTNETATATKSTSGGQMSVVLGIIGAAIGVIAVGIIFMILVRRSRAEEDDEEMATPVNKRGNRAASGPTTSTNATYTSYGQPLQPSIPPPLPPKYPITPTHQVHQYYQDNAQPSPRGSRPSMSQPNVAKTVRPAAAVNPPTFFKAPAPNHASFTQPASSFTLQSLAMEDRPSERVFSDQVHAQGRQEEEEEGEAHLHKRISSPRGRDSYEF